VRRWRKAADLEYQDGRAAEGKSLAARPSWFLDGGKTCGGHEARIWEEAGAGTGVAIPADHLPKQWQRQGDALAVHREVSTAWRGGEKGK